MEVSLHDDPLHHACVGHGDEERMVAMEQISVETSSVSMTLTPSQADQGEKYLKLENYLSHDQRLTWSWKLKYLIEFDTQTI